jgi:hypothetical protein
LLLQLLGAFADNERSLIRERVLAGVRRARTWTFARLSRCSTRGAGLKDVARILKVPRATRRRRLDEAGRWPVERAAAQWVQKARSGRGVYRLLFGGPQRGSGKGSRTNCI